MLVVELIIVLLAIFLGARLGEVLVLQADWGCWSRCVAFNPVTSRSMSFPLSWRLSPLFLPCRLLVVCNYLVHQTEKLLRRNPEYITILAPIVTYFLTILRWYNCNISLATLPVIAEVAKEQGVKPCRPLSTAVVSAQIAITASPISAAVVYMSSVMEGHGISYLHLLSAPTPLTLRRFW